MNWKKSLPKVMAFTGVVLVIVILIGKQFYSIPLYVRSVCLVSGLALMLLGTIWKVVFEMDEPEP